MAALANRGTQCRRSAPPISNGLEKVTEVKDTSADLKIPAGLS
jgi:hypothetical protein